VGGLPFMAGDGPKSSLFFGFRANAAKYGPVFSFYLGKTPCVVISDYDLLKETFNREELTSRPEVEPRNETRKELKKNACNTYFKNMQWSTVTTYIFRLFECFPHLFAFLNYSLFCL
jgi:hypothetical protein